MLGEMKSVPAVQETNIKGVVITLPKNTVFIIGSLCWVVKK